MVMRIFCRHRQKHESGRSARLSGSFEVIEEWALVTHDSKIKRRKNGRLNIYSHAPHNDVSFNDGTHIRRWSHNIIKYYNNIIIPLCYNCQQYSVQ